MRNALDRAAHDLDLTARHFQVRGPEDIAAKLEEVASSNIDALWYSGSPILRPHTEQIMAFLVKRKLPSIANIPLFAEQGGLVHYAPDVEEYFERTADHVDRILKGAKPASLPIHQPPRYELVINDKTAKAIGVAIPPAVRAFARVIS